MSDNKISIKKNMILMLVYRVFVTIAPLITTPLLCRILSPEDIGNYGYTQSICAYFGSIAVLGTSVYGQREIAFLRDDKYEMSKLFWEVLFFRVMTTALSLVVYCMISNKFFFSELRILFNIQIIELIGNLLDISWLYIGIERFTKVFFKNAILKVISIICIFTFVKSENDIYIYVLINSLSIVISNAAFWIGLKKVVQPVKFTNLRFTMHIPAIITLFLPSIASILYNKVDVTMLGIINDNSKDIAYYQQTIKISTICATTISTIGGVIAPRLAYVFSNRGKKELKNYFEKGLDAICIVGVPMSFGLLAISGSLIPWFLGIKYLDVVYYLRIMSPLCFIAGINNYIGSQYLVITKRQNQYTSLIVTGTCINVLCNIILIKMMGGLGAIISSIFSELIILMLGLWIIRKEFKILNIVKISYKKLVSGIIMSIFVYLATIIFPNSSVFVLFEILLGIIIYFLLLYLLKDKYFINICNNTLERIKQKA